MVFIVWFLNFYLFVWFVFCFVSFLFLFSFWESLRFLTWQHPWWLFFMFQPFPWLSLSCASYHKYCQTLWGSTLDSTPIFALWKPTVRGGLFLCKQSWNLTGLNDMYWRIETNGNRELWIIWKVRGQHRSWACLQSRDKLKTNLISPSHILKVFKIYQHFWL